MTRLATLCVIAILWSAMSDQAAAQRRVPGYLNSTPISPYVNLFNGNTGGVNSYFTFVRPLQRQQQINQFQFNQVQQLNQQLRTGGPMMMQGGMVPGAAVPGQAGFLRPGMQGTAMPSTAASYFNYSHYYGVPVNNSPLVGGARGR